MEEKIKEFFRVLKSDKWFQPFRFNEKTISKILTAKEDIYCFIWDKEKIIGIFMLRGFDEGYEIPSLGMIVHPDYRNRGIGTFGMNALIEICKELKCKKIRLTVDKGNDIAKKMYEKAGFKFKTKNAYKDIGFKTL